MSYFTTRGPGKEYGTNKPQPTGRVWERSKGDTMCQSTSKNPFCYRPSWLSDTCTTRKDSESEWLTKDTQEINPITIKPETVSHVAELFFWVPSPSYSPPGCLLTVNSLTVSARVSSDNSFPSVRQKSALGALERCPPSYNNSICASLFSWKKDVYRCTYMYIYAHSLLLKVFFGLKKYPTFHIFHNFHLN